MNRKLLFMMFGFFLFLTLLYVPAKAEDIMSWSPRTFAGGGYASYGDLLRTAVAIKYGSEVLLNEWPYLSTIGRIMPVQVQVPVQKIEEVQQYDYSQD